MPEGGGFISNRRSATTLGLLFILLAFALGCSTPPPPAADLVEPGARLLTDVTLQGARGVLAQRASGELVVTVWKEGGKKDSFHGGGVAGPRPVIGWVQGFEAVAGRFEGRPDARVEVTTGSGTVAGKVDNGAYLVMWPVPKVTGKFVLRILDSQGTELYRWSPAEAPSAA